MEGAEQSQRATSAPKGGHGPVSPSCLCPCIEQTEQRRGHAERLTLSSRLGADRTGSVRSRAGRADLADGARRTHGAAASVRTKSQHSALSRLRRSGHGPQTAAVYFRQTTYDMLGTVCIDLRSRVSSGAERTAGIRPTIPEPIEHRRTEYRAEAAD